MNRTCTVATAVAAAAGIAVAGATAATAAPASSSSHRLNSVDRAFLKSNEQVNLAEITIGKIILKRASSHRAHMLARETIRDHTKAQQAVELVAKKDGVTLPTKPDAAQIRTAEHLETVRPHVALAYYKAQVAGHKESIKQTRTEIRDGSRPDVVKYAEYYLPVAQKHLRMSERDLAALRARRSK